MLHFSLLWHVAFNIIIIIIMFSIFHFCVSWSYISLLYYLVYLGLCFPFFFLMKSKRGRRVCVCLLKISGYEEVMDCKRKGEIYSFMVGPNFQEILSSSKRGRLKKCLPPWHRGRVVLMITKSSRKRRKDLKMKKLARSSEDCNSLVLLSC